MINGDYATNILNKLKKNENTIAENPTDEDNDSIKSDDEESAMHM